MKAKIEVTIRDEAGNVIGQLDPQTLDLGQQRLHDIEGAVKDWRRQVLPDIEAELLSAAQQQFNEQKKNREPQAERTRSSHHKDLARAVRV